MFFAGVGGIKIGRYVHVAVYSSSAGYPANSMATPTVPEAFTKEVLISSPPSETPEESKHPKAAARPINIILQCFLEFIRS